MGLFDSVTKTPRPGAARRTPWQMPAARRPELLEWFLTADFETTEAVHALMRLTGRPVPGEGGFVQVRRGRQTWTSAVSPKERMILKEELAQWPKELVGERLVFGRPSTIAQGKELGSSRIEGPLSSANFIRFYDDIRSKLIEIEESHARWLEMAPSSDKRRVGTQFVELGGLLRDSEIVVARDGFRVREPLEVEHRSTSLVGELALAMLDKLVEARSSVRCRYCGRRAVFPDTRTRITCRRENCLAAYRREWKRSNPEPKERVAERVRRSRARNGGRT